MQIREILHPGVVKMSAMCEVGGRVGGGVGGSVPQNCSFPYANVIIVR